MDQFVVKNQTYDAAIEKMTEALNSGKLTDNDKEQLKKNIAYTLKKKTEVMNDFNRSITSLNKYQTKLESSRSVGYMSQSLENFPLLSDELRSLELFMGQGYRANNLMSEVADFRDPNLQNTSRINLSYYLKARQERIGRDNSPQTFSYQVQIGGKTHVIRLINDRNSFFQQLEKEFKNQ